MTLILLHSEIINCDCLELLFKIKQVVLRFEYNFCKHSVLYGSKLIYLCMASNEI